MKLKLERSIRAECSGDTEKAILGEIRLLRYEMRELAILQSETAWARSGRSPTGIGMTMRGAVEQLHLPGERAARRKKWHTASSNWWSMPYIYLVGEDKKVCYTAAGDRQKLEPWADKCTMEDALAWDWELLA